MKGNTLNPMIQLEEQQLNNGGYLGYGQTLGLLEIALFFKTAQYLLVLS